MGGKLFLVTRFLSAKPDSRLLPLPWSTPLAQWPQERLVALPRGISRHVVRFITVDDDVYAAKEVVEHLAIHEYRLLHDLMSSIPRRSSPSASLLTALRPTVNRWSRSSSPATYGSLCPTGPFSILVCVKEPSCGSLTPSSFFLCDFIWWASYGVTSRCRTYCSDEMPSLRGLSSRCRDR
ncbi:chromosome segregation ATPases [Cutibacterium acnes JCM 18918]|nr:chromosome segregation ATPases [Cutibacterium acnes JCM 18918]